MMDESDLEPEVPHALLVRLNQVRAVRLPLLHYAEGGRMGGVQCISDEHIIT